MLDGTQVPAHRRFCRRRIMAGDRLDDLAVMSGEFVEPSCVRRQFTRYQRLALASEQPLEMADNK